MFTFMYFFKYSVLHETYLHQGFVWFQRITRYIVCKLMKWYCQNDMVQLDCYITWSCIAQCDTWHCNETSNFEQKHSAEMSNDFELINMYVISWQHGQALGYLVWFLPEASFGLRVLSLPARVCVCGVCVRVSVNQGFVCTITPQQFKLGSQNFDQRAKRPWVRALLFCGMLDCHLQGQIELQSQNLPHFELVHAITHHQLKLQFPNLKQKLQGHTAKKIVDFFGSSIKFQGHMGWKLDDLNPVWVRLLGRSQLSNPSDLPCEGSWYLTTIGHTVQGPWNERWFLRRA